MKFDIITDLNTIKKSTRTITGIVVHHSASDRGTSAKDINDWHNAEGWKGIGYHYVVLANCQIQEGRDVDIIGSHAGGHNSHTIGICVIGNYSYEKPHKYPDQMVAVANLVNRLRDIYQVECEKCDGAGCFISYDYDDEGNAFETIPICQTCEGTGTADIPVTGHREHNATECPGSKVDLDQMRRFFDYMRTMEPPK